MKMKAIFMSAIIASSINLFAQENSEVDELQKKIDALKKEVTELEQRAANIKTAETDKNAEAKETAKEEDITKVDTTKEESKLKKISLDQLPISFNGYLRTGFGKNGKGGDQDAFKLPDTISKYRLGNEEETYMELGLDHPLLPNNGGIYADMHWMLSYYENRSDSPLLEDIDNDFDLIQAWAQVYNLFESMPDAKLWVGKRFYDRQGVHMNDLWYLDMTGTGIGISDIQLGNGNLWVALIGDSEDYFYDPDSDSPDELNLDVRWREIKIGQNKLMLWANLSRVDDGDYLTNLDNDNDGNPDIISMDKAYGYGFGAVFEHPLKNSGKWVNSLLYGKGSSSDLSTYGLNLVDIAATVPDQSDVEDSIENADRIRFISNYIHESGNQFSFESLLMWDWHDQGYDGASGDAERNMLSAGIRPIYQFTDYFALQCELGLDYIDKNRTSVSGDGGYLAKFTIAPTIRLAKGQFSRPELRLFFTYANWSDDLEGEVGNISHNDDTHGISVGVQLETWW